jgi:hypothetical protein
MQVIHFDQDMQMCGKFSYPIFCVYSNVVINVLSLKTTLGVGAILYPHWWASKYPLFSLSFFQYFGTFMCSIFFAILRCSYFSLFFEVAPYSFLTLERKTHVWCMESDFWWMERARFCVTLSVSVSILFMARNVNLDHGCMTRISTRVTSIWQNSM